MPLGVPRRRGIKTKPTGYWQRRCNSASVKTVPRISAFQRPPGIVATKNSRCGGGGRWGQESLQRPTHKTPKQEHGPSRKKSERTKIDCGNSQKLWGRRDRETERVGQGGGQKKLTKSGMSPGEKIKGGERGGSPTAVGIGKCEK